VRAANYIKRRSPIRAACSPSAQRLRMRQTELAAADAMKTIAAMLRRQPVPSGPEQRVEACAGMVLQTRKCSYIGHFRY
jgi:hypothetical protein